MLLNKVRLGQPHAYSDGGSETQAKKSQDTEAVFQTAHLREMEKKILERQNKLAENALLSKLNKIKIPDNETNPEMIKNISNEIIDDIEEKGNGGDNLSESDDAEVEPPPKKLKTTVSGKKNRKQKQLIKKNYNRGGIQANPRANDDDGLFNDGDDEEEKENEAELPKENLKTVVCGKKSKKQKQPGKKINSRADVQDNKIAKIFTMVKQISNTVERLSSGLEPPVVDIEKTYNVLLPLQNIAALQDFEIKLQGKKDCQMDTVSIVKLIILNLKQLTRIF